MIGLYVKAWRSRENFSQAELSKRLRNHGWPITQSKLSRLELDAEKGIDHRLDFDQIDAICRATAAPRWEVYFHAGLIPVELRQTSPLPLAPDPLSTARAKVAMAMLYAAMGKPELGPVVSPEVAIEAGLWPPPETTGARAELEADLATRGISPPSAEERALAAKVRAVLPARPEPGPSAVEPEAAAVDLRKLYGD